MKISKNHPRYESLKTREKLVQFWREGVVHPSGLIAQGRGEAFDYIIGERTIPPAREAERVAAALLLIAKNPVISVNGNAAALSGKELVRLANAVPASLEINLFHRSGERVRKVASLLKRFGAKKVLNVNPDAIIPGLDHNRALCSREGVYSSDVVLIPLEDGDRAQALKNMGKIVIAIDLNPLSRTAQTADVTVVDNITRAVPQIIKYVSSLKGSENLKKLISGFDNKKNMAEVLSYIRQRTKK